MSRAALILIIGIVAPFLCLSNDATNTAPGYLVQREHHAAAELTLLDPSAADSACTDVAPLPISRELETRLAAEVAIWRYSVEAGEPQPLAFQPLPISPDTARALLQVYRL